MIPNANQYPGPAWNAWSSPIYNDGVNGASSTIPAGDSPDGQLNLGANQMPQHFTRQPSGGGGGFDVKALLQALLTHSQGAQFNPGVRPQTAQPHQIGIPDLARPMPHTFNGLGPGSGHQMPWDMHHAQVSAAGNLAQFLAQQHTAGLRRYNGRH